MKKIGVVVLQIIITMACVFIGWWIRTGDTMFEYSVFWKLSLPVAIFLGCLAAWLIFVVKSVINDIRGSWQLIRSR